MSDDICEGLRAMASEPWKHDGGSWPDRMTEAAAEITRLRALNADLVKALTKVTDWLVRLAEQHERDSANNKRFPSLAEACATDARNFRKIAADLSSVIARAGETA